MVLVSCQQLAGSGKGKAEFTELRTARTRERARRLSGDRTSRVWGSPPRSLEPSRQIEKRSSAMNMVDREHVALEIATVRRTITETDRWVTAGDLDSVRMKVNQIDVSLGEIDAILERTIRGSVEQSGTS